MSSSKQVMTASTESSLSTRDGVEPDAVAQNSVPQAETAKHILVINDTQDILDLFREILEEDGYRVSLYSFVFQDIAEIRDLLPDLVILDFVIGGEAQGWQMLQKMKMTRETMDIPVIVCTAALSLARELDGHLRAKNVGVVLKPFDIDDLLEAVDSSLKKGAPVSPAIASEPALPSFPSYS